MRGSLCWVVQKGLRHLKGAGFSGGRGQIDVKRDAKFREGS